MEKNDKNENFRNVKTPIEAHTPVTRQPSFQTLHSYNQIPPVTPRERPHRHTPGCGGGGFFGEEGRRRAVFSHPTLFSMRRVAKRENFRRI